jgi:GNAT superfamily N-acetyltransferase
VSAAPHVWRAQAAEAAEVTRLLVEFRDWLGDREPPAQEMARSVELLLGDPATEFLLGSTRGAPEGVCQLRFRHSVWTSTEDCWLEDLYVEEGARGAGLGRALVQAACERARERGALRIELDTNERNHAAIGLYESCGFSASSKSHGEAAGRDLFFGRRL